MPLSNGNVVFWLDFDVAANDASENAEFRVKNNTQVQWVLYSHSIRGMTLKMEILDEIIRGVPGNRPFYHAGK